MQNSAADYSRRSPAFYIGLAGVLTVGASKVITATSARTTSTPQILQQHHEALNMAGWATLGAALGYKVGNAISFSLYKDRCWNSYCQRPATLFNENTSFSGKYDLYYVSRDGENQAIESASGVATTITIGESIHKSKQPATLFPQVEEDYRKRFNQEYSQSPLRYRAYAASILGAVGLASLAHKLGW